ncbi:MAG: phosphoribosyl-ATP diphosphatase [Gammaproteobacteria bacterium]
MRTMANGDKMAAARGTMLGITLGDLAAAIAARQNADAATSYTAQLLAEGGGERLMKKIIEEAGEVSLAAAFGRREQVAEEVADLWYHTLVLMQKYGITLDDIAGILAKRRGMSGIDEKAARAANTSRGE